MAFVAERRGLNPNGHPLASPRKASGVPYGGASRRFYFSVNRSTPVGRPAIIRAVRCGDGRFRNTRTVLHDALREPGRITKAFLPSGAAPQALPWHKAFCAEKYRILSLLQSFSQLFRWLALHLYVIRRTFSTHDNVPYERDT